MPTYEYKCPKCGTHFEAFQRITAKPLAKCPTCGARAERQMSVGAGLVFKGSGFYLTDYGRAGQKSKPNERGEPASQPSGGGSSSTASGGESSASSPGAESAPSPSKPKKKAD